VRLGTHVVFTLVSPIQTCAGRMPAIQEPGRYFGMTKGAREEAFPPGLIVPGDEVGIYVRHECGVLLVLPLLVVELSGVRRSEDWLVTNYCQFRIFRAA